MRRIAWVKHAAISGEPGSAGKWLVVALFWCVYFVNQADRQVIFSVFPLLQRDLGLSNTQLGLLGSSFQWVYAVVVPVAGGLGDMMSRRNLIALALALVVGVDRWVRGEENASDHAPAWIVLDR